MTRLQKRKVLTDYKNDRRRSQIIGLLFAGGLSVFVLIFQMLVRYFSPTTSHKQKIPISLSACRLIEETIKKVLQDTMKKVSFLIQLA